MEIWTTNRSSAFYLTAVKRMSPYRTIVLTLNCRYIHLHSLHSLIATLHSYSIVGDTPGRVLVNSGTFLKNLDRFDYLEFGITAKDAHMMPPSTRKLVELSFLALQDAGVEYRGRNVGCYMSGVAHDLLMVSGHVSQRLCLHSTID